MKKKKYNAEFGHLSNYRKLNFNNASLRVNWSWHKKRNAFETRYLPTKQEQSRSRLSRTATNSSNIWQSVAEQLAHRWCASALDQEKIQ